MDPDIHIDLAREASEEILAAMKHLMPQLTAAPAPELEELAHILGSDMTTLFLARQSSNLIVGMAVLVIVPLPGGLKGWIENVVVDEAHRGKGIGEALILTAINHAREEEVPYIYLTSKPTRVAASKLYQKLGFKRKETNLYQLRVN